MIQILVVERGLDDKSSEIIGNLTDDFVVIKNVNILDLWEKAAKGDKKLCASLALDSIIDEVSHTYLDQSFSICAERGDNPLRLNDQFDIAQNIRGTGHVFRFFLHEIGKP